MKRKVVEEEFPWLISGIICFIVAIAIWQIFPHKATVALQQTGVHITTPTTTSVWIPEGGRYQIYYMTKSKEGKVTPSFVFRSPTSNRSVYSAPPSMDRSFKVNGTTGVLVAEVMFPSGGTYELDTSQTAKTSFLLTNQFPTKAVSLQLVSVVGGIVFVAIGVLLLYRFYVKYQKKIGSYLPQEEEEKESDKIEKSSK